MKYNIGIRPWHASGGSSVHDEQVSYEADSSYNALQQLYAANEYNWEEFRVIYVEIEKPIDAVREHFRGGVYIGDFVDPSRKWLEKILDDNLGPEDKK